MNKETWKRVSFGNRYEVSNKGRVRNVETKKLMKKDASDCVYLSDDGFRYHPSVKMLMNEVF